MHKKTDSFKELTRADINKLRRKSISVSDAEKGVSYSFTAEDVETARTHIKIVYESKSNVTKTFAAKLLLLNEIYKETANEEQNRSKEKTKGTPE